MGSSSPAPTTYIPKPQAPTVFQSLVPKEDFDLASDYINELKAEREKTKAERYLEVGTPEEIGQRMKEREAITAASYLASLPEPEIDYTAGIEPDIMNRVDLFLSDLNSSKQKPAPSGPKPFVNPGQKPAPSGPKTSTSNSTIRELTKEEHAQAAAGAKSLKEYLENQQKIRAGTFKSSPTENTGPKPIQDNRPGAPAPVPYNDPRFKVPSFSGSQPEKRPIVGPLPDNRASSGQKPIPDNLPGPDLIFKKPETRIGGAAPDNRVSSGSKPIQDNRPGVKLPRKYGPAINLS